MVRILTFVVVAVSLTACGGSGGSGGSSGGGSNNPVPTNAAPIANAGSDISQDISPSAITLDASSSSDPDNDTLSFSWSLVSEPASASISLNGATTATPSFVSMVPGDYTFEVTVTDPAGLSATATVVVTLVNQAPTISVAAFDTNIAIGSDVVLDATASIDSNEHALTFQWSITQSPPESGMPLAYSGALQTLRFDAAGVYVLELVVSDGFDPTSQVWNPLDVTVFVVKPLAVAFGDAEYDSINKRIVTVTGSTLVVINADGVEDTVTLPLNAAAVSVAPDGATAAVAHDGWVSLVDLNSAIVVSTNNVPAQLGDIVLDANGYAYGFPETGQWVDMPILDTATGTVRTASVWPLRHRTRARLHPSGTKIYGADNGLSPSDLERYNIGGGDASMAYDSPYHGDFPFCGDLWFGPDGNSILSRCRVVVRSSDNQASDLTFAMQLDNTSSSIAHASSSAYESAWYVIDGDANTGNSQVKVYDAETGNPTTTLALPFIDNTNVQRWIGKFVFADNDSTTIRVLAVDDETNPQAYALIERVDATFAGSNFAPEAIAQRFHTTRTAAPVTLDGSGSSDPEGAALVYQWTLVAEPAGSGLNPGDMTASSLTITPTVPGSYDFELVVSDGVRQSPAAKVTVNAFAAGESLVHRLQGDIVDAEFSKALNAVVYLSGNEMHLLNVSDFSKTVIDVSQQPYRVGVSPDGLFAAVSHAGMASLVDLSSENVADTQAYTDDWGDIVLDHNNRAHLVPNRDQWSYLYSLDFAANQSTQIYGPYAGTQIRMHPVQNWVYGANRGLSPSDFEKWDVSTFPSSSLGDSPYHGDYGISGDIWISEDGDRLVVAAGNTFNASADSSVDMTYAGGLPDSVFVGWADHSTERNEWVVVAADLQYRDDPLENMLVFYEDMFFNQVEAMNFAPIPTSNGPASTSASRVFYSDDGSQVILLLQGDGLLEPYAVQVLDR